MTADVVNSQGLYRPGDFRDNCGFGLIANIKGEASQGVLKTAIASRNRMTHRRAMAAASRTGDGCALLIKKPDACKRGGAQR